VSGSNPPTMKRDEVPEVKREEKSERLGPATAAM
jgi:hypothetical protein